MPTYSDEGIVLRRIDYGESDRILTVLTLEHGKIGVIARGRPQIKHRLHRGQTLHAKPHAARTRTR